MVGGVCWRRPPTAASAILPAQQQSTLKSEAGKRPCRRGDDDGEGQVVEVADGRGSTEAAVAAHGNGEGHPGGARDGEGEGTRRCDRTHARATNTQVKILKALQQLMHYV